MTLGDVVDELERLTDIAVKLIWSRVIDAGINPEPFADLRKVMAAKPENEGRDVPSPADFFSNEHDLLLATLTYLTASPPPAWMESAPDAIAALQSMAREQPRSVRDQALRRLGYAAGHPNSDEPEGLEGFCRRIPFLAAIANFPNMEGAEADATAIGLEDTYVRSRARLQRITEAAIGAAGFQPATDFFGHDEELHDRAFELLTVLVSAAWEGNALRAGLDPAGSGFPLPTGIDGKMQTWQLANLAFHVCSSALLEEGEVDQTPFRMPPPMSQPVIGFGDGPADEIVRAAAQTFVERAVAAFEKPVFFEDVRRAAVNATPPLDPSDFWADELSMWAALLDRMTGPPPLLLTEDWIREECSGASSGGFDGLLETCRLVGIFEDANTAAEAGFIRRLGLLAYLHSTAAPGRSARVVSSQKVEDGYRRTLVALARWLRSYADAIGARPKASLFGTGEEADSIAFELISTLTGSMYEGLRLRTPVDPAIGSFELPTGPDGEDQTWNFFSLAYWCVSSSCLEPVPDDASV